MYGGESLQMARQQLQENRRNFWRSFKGGSRRLEGRDGSNCYD
jgi:hypothetical protein